jgi:hypothetical protein
LVKKNYRNNRTYNNGLAVQEYINNVNAQGYAGITDWRLPTIEELAALLPGDMTSERLYIDAEFTGALWNCLSASPVKGGAEGVGA